MPAPLILELYPDRYYSAWYFISGPAGDNNDRGFGWSLSPHKEIESAFVLKFGERRLVIRSEWGSDIIDLLDEAGRFSRS